MIRTIQACTLAAMLVATLSCSGGSSLDDTEAAVFLTVEITEYSPDIDICTLAGTDVVISDMSITSTPKNPDADLTATQDVRLTRWTVRPYRTDGGATASPEWQYDLSVYVPAGGNTNLENYRIFPAEYFLVEPLVDLLPENGGVDDETGNTNIRQSLELQLFGRTVSGKAVATEPVNVAFNFFCVSP